MRRWALAVIFTFLLGLPVFILPAASQEEPSARNVLIRKSFTNRDGFIELGPFKAGVRARLSMPVNFNIEYLESTRFGDEGYRRNVREALIRSPESISSSLPNTGTRIRARVAVATHAEAINAAVSWFSGTGGRDDPSQNSAGG